MIAEILALAAKLPAGLPDPDALKKLTREMDEFNEAIEANDTDGALTEAADIGYYVAKLLDYVAGLLSLDADTVLLLAVAKYTLRARPGNPKDDAAERAACRAVV